MRGRGLQQRAPGGGVLSLLPGRALLARLDEPLPEGLEVHRVLHRVHLKELINLFFHPLRRSVEAQRPRGLGEDVDSFLQGVLKAEIMLDT